MGDNNFCVLCNVSLPDKSARESHFIGRKHQLAVHNEHILNKKEKCGVFVTGLPNLVAKEQIVKFFSDFGPTKDVFIGEGNRFALVEFSDEATAQSLLKKQKVFFMGKTLYIKPRKRKEQANEPNIEQPHLDHDLINTSLKNLQFEEQINKLMEHLQPNQKQQIESYKILCEDLQLTLQQIFKEGCRIFPFGSTVTGLNFKYSDVDVFVEVANMLDSDPTTQTFIKKARNALPKSKSFAQVLAIPKAKTPIVKCVHVPTQLSCDFNFKNMLGVCNTYLIKYYMSLAPQLRTVTMIIKYWASSHELHGNSSKFSNYALTIMFIFYLQQEPFRCESVIEMQKSPGIENIQHGWNGGFLPANLTNENLSNKSIFELLEGFFKYYSQFDYSLYVVCPYLGKIVPKTDFLRPDILSDDFLTYKINLVNMFPLLVDTPICVQDPFEHNHNLTKAVSSRVADDFKLFCKHALNTLQEKNKKENDKEGPLYKFFTSEPLDERFTLTENVCKFKLIMGQSLKYLEKKIPENCENRPNEIKFVWYSMVNEFIINVLAKALKCDISVTTDKQIQREEGVLDSVSLRCKAMQNLWESRRAIRRDIELNNNATNLEKEIQVTNYICEVLCKNITLLQPIVDFTITINARDNPIEMDIIITKHNSMKGCFRSICTFLAIRLPHWLNAHEREMNENVNKTAS
ncbi:speckle targeted PIP5K1A-regulated poly(A) polymerase-like isoform X1 [Onthophagus taurus]|uniref:speckle targeted PIP5K1A-regulated poly(A) polymerase-like isoform X1 n=1 Tax=Onthophagus taurus TaxID=166361 RepID=UPI000C20748E|nr:speckle targeted PIP5K1A-regulated poly(A) polymerase-like [Onthophagus taurus]